MLGAQGNRTGHGIVQSIPSYRLGEEQQDSCLVRKDLRVLVSRWLNMSLWCAWVAKEVNRILVCISSVASRTRAVIVPLHSALARAHLECCIYFWSPYYKKDIKVLECVQERQW